MDRASSVCGLAFCALFAGCMHGARSGGGGEGGSESFSIAYPDATAMSTPAHVGKHFQAKPAGQCSYANGREARWTMGGARVASGALPPGLALEDGVIGGVPTSAGTFIAKVEFSDVNCAGKALEKQSVDVAITVK